MDIEYLEREKGRMTGDFGRKDGIDNCSMKLGEKAELTAAC